MIHPLCSPSSRIQAINRQPCSSLIAIEHASRALQSEPFKPKRNRNLAKMSRSIESFPVYIDPYTTTRTTLEPPSTNPPPTSKPPIRPHQPQSSSPLPTTKLLPALHAPSSTPQNLTFGVEFEFILAVPLTTLPTPPPSPTPTTHSSLTAFHDSHICARLVRTLRRGGLSVNPWEGRVVDYSLWTVDQDASICASAPSRTWHWHGYHFCGVELKTPVLDYSVEGISRVARALEVLGAEYGERVFVNESCGLHVHVGSLGASNTPSDPKGTKGREAKKSAGFALNTLKNIATLVTVFNRLFNSLHPSHRISNPHCRSPAASFRDLDPWLMAEAINQTKSVDALAALMCRCPEGEERGMAYNFLNLSKAYGALGGGAGLNTIEFRQHAATLDAREVGVWVTLCCEVVTACGRMGAVGIVGLVVKHLKTGMREDVYGICDLLGDLGLGALKGYYEGRGVYRHEKMEWEVRDPRMVGVEMVFRDLRAEAEAEMEARGWPVNCVDMEVDEDIEDHFEEFGLENLFESDVEEDIDVMLDRLDANLRMQQRGVWR